MPSKQAYVTPKTFRLELRVIFGRLIERLEHVELAGEFERVSSSFLGGVKHMPIRYSLRSAN